MCSKASLKRLISFFAFVNFFHFLEVFDLLKQFFHCRWWQLNRHVRYDRVRTLSSRIYVRIFHELLLPRVLLTLDLDLHGILPSFLGASHISRYKFLLNLNLWFILDRFLNQIIDFQNVHLSHFPNSLKLLLLLHLPNRILLRLQFRNSACKFSLNLPSSRDTCWLHDVSFHIIYGLELRLIQCIELERDLVLKGFLVLHSFE